MWRVWEMYREEFYHVHGAEPAGFYLFIVPCLQFVLFSLCCFQFLLICTLYLRWFLCCCVCLITTDSWVFLYFVNTKQVSSQHHQHPFISCIFCAPPFPPHGSDESELWYGGGRGAPPPQIMSQSQVTKQGWSLFPEASASNLSTIVLWLFIFI